MLLRCQYNPKLSTESVQSCHTFFCRNRYIHPKIHMESQGTLNSQNNFEKEEWSSWEVFGPVGLFWLPQWLRSPRGLDGQRCWTPHSVWTACTWRVVPPPTQFSKPLRNSHRHKPFCLFLSLAVNSILHIVVQLLSRVWLFETLWTAACQASLSFTISWSLLKLMSIELVMRSNHLILCHPLLCLLSVFPSIRVFFPWVGCFHQVAKVWKLPLQRQFFQWIFRVNFL